MIVGDDYAVWLTESGARAFLGIGDAPLPPSRWLVLGECIGEEGGIGFWIRIDHVEQWTGTEKQLITISLPRCLIRWEYVISMQALEDVDEFPDPDEWKN